MLEFTKNIDSAWALTVINNTRYIIGSIYVKLNYENAIDDVMKMLHEAEKLSKKYKALGVILSGDYNARHEAWGDTVHNKYGTQLVDKLDNAQFTIHTANTPTFRTENGSSVIDLIITSTRLSDRIKQCHTNEEVELYSGAPIRGHLPLLSKIVIPNQRHNQW